VYTIITFNSINFSLELFVFYFDLILQLQLVKMSIIGMKVKLSFIHHKLNGIGWI
jgi:hypothetical protein